MENTGTGFSLKVKFKELAKLSEVIDKLGEKVELSDISFRTSVATEFGKVISEDVRNRFIVSPATTAGGKVPPGVHWRELSDSYLRNRPDRLTGRILVDSGTLMNSFQTDSSDFISQVDNQWQYTVGTKVGYSAKLQETWPFVFLHSQLMDKLAKAHIDWLTKEMK